MQDSAGGVLGMIEVIQSDFVRLESETRAEEAQAQEQYACNIYEVCMYMCVCMYMNVCCKVPTLN